MLDLRTLIPWDREAVLESVAQLLEGARPPRGHATGGFGAEIAATIVEEAFEQLDAPVRRIAAPDAPVPFAPSLEKAYHPAGRRRRGRLCATWPHTEDEGPDEEDDVSTGTQVEVVMPQMGVSVAEGTITRWLKQPGDNIALDEPLLEISTDKVDTEVPSPGEGILVEMRVQEGETVEVGTVLAVIGPAGAAPSSRKARRRRRRPSRAPRDAGARAVSRHPSRSPGAKPAARARDAALAGAERSLRRRRARRRQRRRALRRRAPATGRPSSRPSSRGSPRSTESTRARSRDGPGRSRDEEGHPRLHRVRGGRVSGARRGARRAPAPATPAAEPAPAPARPACPRRGVSAGRAGAAGRRSPASAPCSRPRR